MDLQSLFDDGDEHVRRDRGPDLRFHGVLGRAVELLDPKMLLDPLEEQLHLPSAAVQLGNRQCWQDEVVRQEHEPPAGLRVVEPNASQWRLEVLAGVEAGQDDRLVADEPGTPIHGTRIATLSFQVQLPADDEEAAGAMKPKNPLEIQVSPIHDVEGTGLRQQLIEDVDVMHLAVADVDKCRDIASKIEQLVELHGTLRRATWCPGKDRETQIDRRGVQRVDRLFQIHAKRLVDVQLPSHGNQSLRKRCVDTPAAHLVRLRESPARNPTAFPHVIELVALRPQAYLDVPKALAVGVLREREAEKLLETREALDLVLAAVRCHAATKRRERQMARQLGENQLARVHGVNPRRGSSQGRTGACRSRNRDQKKSRLILGESTFYKQIAR